MLRRAYARGGIGAVRADAGRLPFPDAGFERVMVTDALHHFRFQQQVIRELGRVLVPGGVLVIEEFDIGRIAVKTLAVLEKMTLMGSRFLRAEQIRELVLATGLKAEIVAGESLSVLVVAKK
jgi:demethylmenaquinone methyltransferase/2-methoxy-6-polyprenyl-1,4-benzoquinol methylase